MHPLSKKGVPFHISYTMAEHMENERRLTPDRRDGIDRRDGRDRRRDEDRNNARRLPDEFAQAAGGTDDRVAGLVNRYWAGYAAPARGQLTEALLPVLQELAEPGAPVTEQHREQCVQVVVDWATNFDPPSMD